MVGLSGLKDVKQVCDTVIKPGGAEGFSTFWGYYVLWALAEAGETAVALNMIREYWGAMIDLGATTFWEDFDIKWAENACLYAVPSQPLSWLGERFDIIFEPIYSWRKGDRAGLSKN